MMFWGKIDNYSLSHCLKT